MKIIVMNDEWNEIHVNAHIIFVNTDICSYFVSVKFYGGDFNGKEEVANSRGYP